MSEKLTSVSGTLYVPMLGRIYASRHHPDVVNDEKALMLEKKIPALAEMFKGQTEYTLMASAVRSMNVDAVVKAFLEANPDGVIVNLGCGLETTFFRSDNGRALWLELDLPAVIELREALLGKAERDVSISASVFEDEWLETVRSSAGGKAVLFTASGLFHYFAKPQVLELIRRIASVPNAVLVFDAVNSIGMKRMAGYMKQFGHEDAAMHFYVDDAKTLAKEISDTISVIEERPYFSRVGNRREMKIRTRIAMAVSDSFRMLKMITLKLN